MAKAYELAVRRPHAVVQRALQFTMLEEISPKSISALARRLSVSASQLQESGVALPDLNLLSRHSRRLWIAYKRRFSADYQRAAEQATLSADKKTGLRR
jgi:hypothetical protein